MNLKNRIDQFLTTYSAQLAVFSIGLLIFTLAGIVGYMEKDKRSVEDQMYCDMVEIYENSDGEFGWPPSRTRIDCGES